jgi:TolB protein
MMKLRSRLLLIIIALGIGVVGLAAPAQATFPGPNGRIAYHAFDPNTGLAFALYTANPDGSHVTEVARVPMVGFSNWSADGKHLSYDYFDADGNEQIATTNPDGEGTHTLTSGPVIHEAPAFSPDGKKIVHAYAPTFGPDFHTTLWIMNADGTNQHQLGSPNTFDDEPDFSPDGVFIVFGRERVLSGPPYQQNALFVMPADGTGPLRRITTWDQLPELPSWSPDGEWIAYFTHDGEDRSIHLVRPDGSQNHVIYQGQVNGEGSAPAFSPDGTKIMFTCSRNNHQRSFDADICIMNADGTEVQNITRTAGPAFQKLATWGTAPLK